MAIIPLTDTPTCVDFFRRGILANLHYWQDHPAVKTTDTAILDNERNGLIRAITFALDWPEAWPVARALIEAVSPYMERRGYWEIWRTVLGQAILVAQQTGDLAGAVALSVQRTRLWQWQGRFKEAIAGYQNTVHLARRIDDLQSEARAYSNLSFLLTEQGSWWRAEVVCCHALVIFEHLDNSHGRAHTENHLGILYTRQHNLELARQHLERACALWQSMSDQHGLMRGFINLGLLYNEMECPDEALSYLEKAMYLTKLTGEETEVGYMYMNIGIAHRLRGESDQAEVYAWKAETIFRRFANSLGLAQIWGNLGLAYLDQGKWLEAHQYLQVSLEAWRNLENKPGEIKTMGYLLEYELAKGNHLQATQQLKVVEHLVSQYAKNGQSAYWQSLLAEYHRLVERSEKTSKV